MQVNRFQKKPVDIPKTVVTIGNFDGIHLGHRELISAAVNEAHLRGCASALVTFNPHPQEIIHSQHSVSHICTSVHQLQLLEEQGLDEVHVIQFTSELCYFSLSFYSNYCCFAFSTFLYFVWKCSY